MKRLLIVLIASSLIWATAQSPTGSGLSPKDVVERLWKEATEGKLLTPEGWNEVSSLFVTPEAFPANASIRIVSNNWGVGHSSVSNDTAEVDMEYTDAGIVDASLKYSPPLRTGSYKTYKTAMVFHLVFVPTHWTMFKSDGKTITGKEERTGPLEWQIQEPVGLPWTTVNTAVRYVLEKRETATDPAIIKNADETLHRLLKLH
jgi:hypothetical protein